MIISAYTVETNTPEFAPCVWHVTKKMEGEKLAQHLSVNLNRCQYPNAFWVMAGNKPICKYFEGKRYSKAEII